MRKIYEEPKVDVLELEFRNNIMTSSDLYDPEIDDMGEV